jgi:hypothetical protein
MKWTVWSYQRGNQKTDNTLAPVIRTFCVTIWHLNFQKSKTNTELIAVNSSGTPQFKTNTEIAVNSSVHMKKFCAE